MAIMVALCAPYNVLGFWTIKMPHQRDDVFEWFLMVIRWK